MRRLLLLLLLGGGGRAAAGDSSVAVVATGGGRVLLAYTSARRLAADARLSTSAPSSRSPGAFGFVSGGVGDARMNEQQLTVLQLACQSSAADGAPTGASRGCLCVEMDALARSALERCASARCALRRMGDVRTARDADAQGSRAAYTAVVADKHGDAWVFQTRAAPASGDAVAWAAQRLADGHVTLVSSDFVVSEAAARDAERVAATDDALAAASSSRCRMWRQIGRVVSLEEGAWSRCSLSAASEDAGGFAPFAVRGSVSVEDALQILRGASDGDERAASEQRAAFSVVLQTRRDVPDALGGVFWFGAGDPRSTVFLPFSCAQRSVPGVVRSGGALSAANRGSAFHAFAAVSSLVQSDVGVDLVRRHLAPLQSEALKLQRRFARELAGLGDSAAIARLLEWDLNALAASVVAQSWELADRLALPSPPGDSNQVDASAASDAAARTGTTPEMTAFYANNLRIVGADWQAPVLQESVLSAMAVVVLVAAALALIVAKAARRRRGYASISAL